MLISELTAVSTLPEKVVNFASRLKDGWYKSSAELASFPDKVKNLTLRHEDWISLLQKFGRSDDEVLTAFVKEADKILSEELKHVDKWEKSKFARLKQRVFPERLTVILGKMEMLVNSGPELLRSRDENLDLLDRAENRTESPLPFQPDRKYVPIADSVAEVRTAVESMEGSRVVILYGEAGLGKTSLAKYLSLHYHNMRHERPQAGSASQMFSDGVFFLRCGKGASTRIKELQQELLESLGSGSETTTASFHAHENLEGEHQNLRFPPPRSLRFKLKRRKALIILDDVWEREVLEGLLVPGEAVTYLITSQKRDIWSDARKILLKKPTVENAEKILAMYTESSTELPKDAKGVIYSIIDGVGFHPLMLANIGVAMGATGGSSLSEWTRMAKGWRDELHQRDFEYHPVLHGLPYKLSMKKTMSLMMDSLDDGERSLLLLMSVLENEQLPEEVVRIFRKRMQPGEAYYDYRRYRDQLKNKSLLEVYSSHVQGSSASRSDTEYSQTCLAIHPLRAFFMKKYYSEQIRSMAKHALQPANHMNSSSANPWMIGGGLWGAITATSDRVRSLVTWGTGPVNNQTVISMTGVTGGCGKEQNSACGPLAGIMAAMYIDRTLWDAVESKTLRAAYESLNIIPRRVHGDVTAIDLVNTVREKKTCIRRLVRLLNPDEEEGWKQEAHQYASKIILRFICRQELDDISVAQLIQVHPDTTAIICDTLLDILEDGYWASQFVDQNITFSSGHSETTKTLFDLFYNDNTSINILESVFGALEGVYARRGILNYEDEDTIVKVLMKVLPKIVNDRAINPANRPHIFFLTSLRVELIIRKIPDLRKRVVGGMLDAIGTQPVIDNSFQNYFMFMLSAAKWFATEIIETPGALDMLWAQIGSSANKRRGEYNALYVLRVLGGVSGVDKNRIIANQTGLINLLDKLKPNQDGRDLGKTLTSSNKKYPLLWNTRDVDELFDIVKLLGNLGVTKEVRKKISHLCPELPERLHILERVSAESLKDDNKFVEETYNFVAAVSEARTLFDPRLVYGGTTPCNPPISPEACFGVVGGRVSGYMALEMYKEAIDAHHDFPPDMSGNNPSWWRFHVRQNIVFAKAMLQDYTGALVIVNDMLLEFQEEKSFFYGSICGNRGVLIRLSSGNLAQALADLDMSLKLTRALYFKYGFDDLCSAYYVLKHRGFVKHLMGDDTGAKEDAHSAQELQRRSLVSNRTTFLWDNILLRQPVDYLGIGGERIGSYYRNEVKEAIKDYKSVTMLGDSMGAGDALMFSHLATSIIACCPQVDLTSSSIRPGRDQEWLNSFMELLLRSVSKSSADIAVHCGNWSHDLEQARLLLSSKVNVVKHGVDDHRLAKERESGGHLLTIVQSKIEKALDFTKQDTLVKGEV